NLHNLLLVLVADGVRLRVELRLRQTRRAATAPAARSEHEHREKCEGSLPHRPPEVSLSAGTRTFVTVRRSAKPVSVSSSRRSAIGIRLLCRHSGQHSPHAFLDGCGDGDVARLLEVRVVELAVRRDTVEIEELAA